MGRRHFLPLQRVKPTNARKIKQQLYNSGDSIRSSTGEDLKEIIKKNSICVENRNVFNWLWRRRLISTKTMNQFSNSKNALLPISSLMEMKHCCSIWKTFSSKSGSADVFLSHKAQGIQWKPRFWLPLTVCLMDCFKLKNCFKNQ